MKHPDFFDGEERLSRLSWLTINSKYFLGLWILRCSRSDLELAMDIQTEARADPAQGAPS